MPPVIWCELKINAQVQVLAWTLIWTFFSDHHNELIWSANSRSALICYTTLHQNHTILDGPLSTRHCALLVVLLLFFNRPVKRKENGKMTRGSNCKKVSTKYCSVRGCYSNINYQDFQWYNFPKVDLQQVSSHRNAEGLIPERGAGFSQGSNLKRKKFFLLRCEPLSKN